MVAVARLEKRLMRNAAKVVVRKTRDSSLRFALVSVCIHIGVLLLAHYIMGARLLTTPPGMVLVVMVAGQLAMTGPSVHERTGSLRQAGWLVIGVPITLVVVGIALAATIEHSGFERVTQAAVFAPWWCFFFVVTIWHQVRMKNQGQITWGFGKPLTIALIAIMAVPLAVLAFAFTVLSFEA